MWKRIGDRTRGWTRTKKAAVAATSVIVAVLTIGAAVAEISGYSLRDLFGSLTPSTAASSTGPPVAAPTSRAPRPPTGAADACGQPASTAPFAGTGSVTPHRVQADGKVFISVSFTAVQAVAGNRVHLEIRSPSDQQVFAENFEKESFCANETRKFTAEWAIPADAAPGEYFVKAGVVSDDWGTWFVWLDSVGSFTVTSP